jgi:hypothetical protein
VMVGLTGHLDKATDVYVFAGGEFAAPAWSDAHYPKAPWMAANVYAFGYGNPAFVNTGCNFEGAAGGATISLTTTAAVLGVPGACVGQTKDVRQATTGVWHNFYDGPAGKIRAGLQYSYTIRDSFQGVGGSFKGTENTIFASFRYYPFN